MNNLERAIIAEIDNCLWNCELDLEETLKTEKEPTSKFCIGAYARAGQDDKVMKLIEAWYSVIPHRDTKAPCSDCMPKLPHVLFDDKDSITVKHMYNGDL